MIRAHFVLLSATLFLAISLTDTAEAQWSAGVSYELRNEAPANGFGVRVDRSIFPEVTAIDIGLRAHFSYFAETNSLSHEGVTIERNFETFDLGVAGTGGITVGLVKPYVGLGIGLDNSSLEFSEPANNQTIESRFPFNKADFYWNGFLGAEVSVSPLVFPFIEYRFSQISGRDDINLRNVSRLALGISLRF
ncbi:hypothetical protein BH23BAC3_BH23BAC3_11050 [soil metagenome]